ncbi:MAG: hypothetical protein N3A66_07695, partial [Planctomycetota bacterium]|nr:hypothetical protein [Planctomycetota bacterium]
IHLCYEVGMGNDYTTVPVPGVNMKGNFSHHPAFIYWQLAHKSPCHLPLFIDKKRIDEVYGPEHRRVLREYHEFLPLMHRRYLQEDGLGVVWHDRRQKRALLWNFAARQRNLPGLVTDLSTGQRLGRSRKYRLEPLHTYAIEAADLPQVI